jgi:hypothetical protein
MNGINFEIEDLVIPNINALLSHQELQAKLVLMDKIIEKGCPVEPAKLLEDEMIHALDAKGVIVHGKDGAVSVVYPVSALPTPHKVKLKDGRLFYAICAVDSLGSAFTFEQDIVVTSSCSHCQRPVSVTIENGEISTSDPGGICVTHTDLAGEVNWAGTC